MLTLNARLSSRNALLCFADCTFAPAAPAHTPCQPGDCSNARAEWIADPPSMLCELHFRTAGGRWLSGIGKRYTAYLNLFLSCVPSLN